MAYKVRTDWWSGRFSSKLTAMFWHAVSTFLLSMAAVFALVTLALSLNVAITLPVVTMSVAWFFAIAAYVTRT